MISVLLSILSAATVSIIDSNIYIHHTDGFVKQLSKVGRDSYATLSPDQKIIAFVRLTSIEFTDTEDQVNHSELDIFDSSGANVRVLVHENSSYEPTKRLSGFNGLIFSLDGKYLYFVTDGWSTSGAIHRIEIATKKIKFITDGNNPVIIPKGKYAGYLAVDKHKYYSGGGSYDNYWLVSPAGKEIKMLGGSNNVEFFIEHQ